jgi:hypothetical protein
MPKHNPPSARDDYVVIRKSSPQQDEKPQIANVEKMLKDIGVYVPRENGVVYTVSRRKLKTCEPFNRLMEKVRADRVRTLYVETQDRWGTGDEAELFSLFGTLRDHGTKLFDLKAGKDLTERDLTTKVITFTTASRAKRSSKTSPTAPSARASSGSRTRGPGRRGPTPTATARRAARRGGALKWVFIPIDRKRGQILVPDAAGDLVPSGPPDAKIPRKEKRDIVKLVPGRPEFVRAVVLIFELYVRSGLSRRQIAMRLNAEGLSFGGGPFTEGCVTDILKNPAYVGDTAFGKVQTGELHTFNAQGVVVEVKGKREALERDPAEWIVRKDTHEPLVDRETFALAQKKLAWESEQRDKGRPNYSPATRPTT